MIGYQYRNQFLNDELVLFRERDIYEQIEVNHDIPAVYKFKKNIPD